MNFTSDASIYIVKLPTGQRNYKIDVF